MKRSSFALLGGGVALGAWALGRALRSDYSFTGKVVLISGGSRGLALVIARQLAAEGARLALLARSEDELAHARADLEERGTPDVLTVACDLTNCDEIASAVDRVLAHFDGVDVLINNAGVIEVGPLEHMTRDDFERSLAIHFWAPYELTMRLRSTLRERAGRIVNISSIGGKIAVPHLAPYCAGKFALTGFSDSIRAELAREGIAVTTVAPGLMRTGSHLNARFKGEHSAEFAWFSFSNAMPLVSMSAERAARKIIAACRRGQPSLTLTFVARFAIAGNAVAPNLTGYAMKLGNHFLPDKSDAAGDRLQTGWESREKELRAFTRHLEAATMRNNEQL